MRVIILHAVVGLHGFHLGDAFVMPMREWSMVTQENKIHLDCVVSDTRLRLPSCSIVWFVSTTVSIVQSKTDGTI